MRSLYRHLTLIAFGLSVIALPALPATAAETFSSELVIVTEGDVVVDDVYAVGNRVLVRGVIDGDLIALAAQDIRIEGEVTGSVLAMAPEVVVTGAIGGALRVLAPSVEVTGSIGRDLVSGAGRLEVASSGEVGRDVILWAWDAVLTGEIGGDVEGTQRNLGLAGLVEGDVRVSANRLSITDALTVGGDLGYRSGTIAAGLDRVEVGGTVVRQEPMAPNIRVRALGFVLRVIVAIALSSLALLVVWASPKRTERALESLQAAPIKAIGTGALIVASPLIVVAIGALLYALAPASAAVPLLVALVPLVLALFGLLLVVSLVGGVPMVAWVGSRLRKDITIAGAVALGALVVAVAWMIPVVGGLVGLFVLTGGIGAWINSLRVESAHQPAAPQD